MRRFALSVIMFSFCVMAVSGRFELSAQDATLSLEGVNSFDRSLMAPYSATLDLTSDVTQLTAMAFPALLALAAPTDEWLTVGCLYAGSFALAYGSKEILKACLPRYRPYIYYSAELRPEDYPTDGDASFPSGHTTMAFNAAAFITTVYALDYPDAPSRWPVTAAAWALAAGTGALRVAGGSHFATDVLVGAALGSAWGVSVPLVAHLVWPRSAGGSLTSGASAALSFNVLPNGVAFGFAY